MALNENHFSSISAEHHRGRRKYSHRSPVFVLTGGGGSRLKGCVELLTTTGSQAISEISLHLFLLLNHTKMTKKRSGNRETEASPLVEEPRPIEESQVLKGNSELCALISLAECNKVYIFISSTLPDYSEFKC